ncbi:MAG: glycoside hydrolase family 43 protein [Eubacterium sp.]|nr:glycoside hydrolase family 43 protein [Eubacterium sp.]
MKTVKTNEVNIRDPYILVHDGAYYLYGTRSATAWGEADGFDCYISKNMQDWEGPVEIFHRPAGFFADRSYWAPECIYKDGAFYLVTTLEGEGIKKGIYILRSDSPVGPFVPYSGRLTPDHWSCIDGTVYFEQDTPILLFSHSFEDSPDGDMCAVTLQDDLKSPAAEAVKLFSAVDAKWAHPVPFAKEEFGMDGDVYFTDGPCVRRFEDGRLYMTWSSWGTCGYAVGVSVSEEGIFGAWTHLEKPLFPVNGGHGMMFECMEGKLRFVLHFPNDKYKERPRFEQLKLEHGELALG